MSSWGTAEFYGETKIERPVSIQTALAQKQQQRDDLLMAVQMFQNGGGQIQHIPYGVSKDQQLIKMRAGELPLITARELAARWKLRGGALPTVLNKFDSLMFIMLYGQKAFWINDIEKIEQTKDFATKGKRSF